MSTSLDFQALLSSLIAKPRDEASAPSSPAPAQMTTDSTDPSILGFARAPPPTMSPAHLSQVPGRPLSSTSQKVNERSNTAQSLLSLLNFGQTDAGKENIKCDDDSVNQSKPESDLPEKVSPQIPSMSASDLVAKFMSSAPRGEGLNRLQFSGASGTGASEKVETPSPSTSQDALLRLLNRSASNGARSTPSGSVEHKPAQDSDLVKEGSMHEPDGTKSPKNTAESQERPDSLLKVVGSTQSKEATPLESVKSEERPQGKETSAMFTYKNPFEALNASRTQTPKPQTPTAQSNTPLIKTEVPSSLVNPAMEERIALDSSPNPTSTRRKLTPRIPGRTSSTAHETSGLKSQDSDFVNPQNSHPSAALNMEISTATDVPAIDGSKTKSSVDEPIVNQAQEQHHASNEMFRNDDAEHADAWESAEDSPIKDTAEREVPVFNFPIKPFVSITIQQLPSSSVTVREDGVMEISRLKKEFDQMDRSLASATSKYISYALTKNGGIRIIRQDDGSDRQVFKNSHDRIFNVSFCSTAMSAPPSNDQAVLGTGVSGTVYYATISKEGNDLFEENMLDTESLIFPPFPVGDENTSGGVLKTRAKRSARHPEFFGIGRGKNIYIVWPATALSSKFGISATNRRVDVEKLYKERALRITTGKAGKDFTFSEDDSLIVSLDKTGRLRFWDIRPLVNEANATAAKVTPINVDTPLLTLSTASPSQKAWPTSVLFVDKLRPYTKGGALRYILVGLRQNHSLQLWDVALGKAVQELNFPHDSESDGVCSVNYHPNSGIIVVGHPTRNSIYFIHLSAPKYTLPHMSQANFINRIAIKDPDLPHPDSTACMSGLREISFAGRGHLRSVELLPIYKTADADSKVPIPTHGLFELYVVHSKGVTCLTINKEDLGWSAESKVLRPVDAVAEGIITLSELRLGGFIDEPLESKSQSEELAPSTKSSKKKSTSKVGRQSEDALKPKEIEVETEANLTQDTNAASESVAFDILPLETAPKEIKKQKKRSAPATSEPTITNFLSRGSSPSKAASKETLPPPNPTEASTMAFRGPPVQPTTGRSVAETGLPSDILTTGLPGDRLSEELKRIESGISTELHKELDRLYQNLQNDRNVQDSASVGRQEAVLRLISTTLSTNVEKNLSRMISTQMQQTVVPAITGAVLQAVTAQVGEAVARVLHQLVPHELLTQVPVAINTALHNPQISRNVAEAVSQKVAAQVDIQVAEVFHKSIMPSFKTLAISTTEKAANELELRLGAQVRKLEADRGADVAKIDKFSQVLQGMAETLQAMSDSQVAFQAQILKDRRQLAQLSDASSASVSQQVSTARQPLSFSAPRSATLTKNGKSSAEIELEEISEMMNEGKYEEGSIKWLQSSQPVELFDNLFVRFTPEYLSTDVSPLVAFSIAITVANSLSTNTSRRIEWIDSAFDAVDIRDPEIADLSQHAPSLLSSLIQKLAVVDRQVSSSDPSNQIRGVIARLTKKAQTMRVRLLGSGLAPT